MKEIYGDKEIIKILEDNNEEKYFQYVLYPNV